jgi:hypothetical protein
MNALINIMQNLCVWNINKCLRAKLDCNMKFIANKGQVWATFPGNLLFIYKYDKNISHSFLFLQHILNIIFSNHYLEACILCNLLYVVIWYSILENFLVTHEFDVSIFDRPFIYLWARLAEVQMSLKAQTVIWYTKTMPL